MTGAGAAVACSYAFVAHERQLREAAESALGQERVAAAARLAEQAEETHQAAIHQERVIRQLLVNAEVSLEQERTASAARLAEQAKEIQENAIQQEKVRAHAERLRADIARHEAMEQAEEARQDTIRQERARATIEKTREWTELNRDYPIPDHLEGFVTGIGILDDACGDSAAGRFVNIGIIGESGTGKSSLARELLRQFGSGCEEDPLVNCESEGTITPTSYVVPGFGSRVRLWDLPGQGTERFPAASYLRDMGLRYFDALLVVTDGRWKTNDSILLDAIRDAEVWLKVVRTKIDLAVESGAYDHGMSQESTLKQARASLQEQLINVTDPRAIHLVTNRPHFWIGGHGGAPYGLVSILCNEVLQYIENRVTNGLHGGAHGGATMVEAIPNDQGRDFEVIE